MSAGRVAHSHHPPKHHSGTPSFTPWLREGWEVRPQSAARFLKERLMTIATEGDEVEVSRLLITFETRRHGSPKCIVPTLRAKKTREGWGTRRPLALRD